MIIAGAKGHAKEILQVLSENADGMEIFLFDNLSKQPAPLFNRFKVLQTEEEVKAIFKTDRRFVLGTGAPNARKILAQKFIDWGGQLTSVISKHATIGSFEVNLGDGLNLMPGAIIYNSATVGEGSLINTYAVVHHDASVGAYCEIGPSAHILGGASVGDQCMIGSGAKILPRIKVNDGAIIGAGAIVNQNIPAGEIWAGVPARKIK